MKSLCFLFLPLSGVNGFAPVARPGQSIALLSATPDDEVSPTTLRKRDRVKNVVKNAFGLNKETEDEDSPVTKPEVIRQDPPARRKMVKAVDGKRYENIECVEEKAYQILKDLKMIEEHN